MAVDLPNQHTELQQLAHEDVDRLRDLLLRDLFFFAEAIMGFKDLTERFHRPICDFLDGNASRYKLVMLPRSAFKTSLCTVTRNARDALREPNRRYAIMNEIEDRAMAWLTTIRTVYESNPIIRTVCSDVIPATPRDARDWSASAVTLHREVEVPEPTLAAYGITTSLAGWHHTDWTIDDPISEKAREEAASMERAINRVSRITALMVDPSEDRQTFVGTPYTKHDVIAHFRNAYGADLATYWMPAVLNDQLMFPERLTWKVLEEARRTLGDLAYSANYLLKPRDVTTEDFRATDIRYFRMSSDESIVHLLRPDGTAFRSVLVADLDITMTLDPAVSENASNDDNAIVVCGTTGDGYVVVLETWAERATPTAVVDQLIAMYLKWAPRVVGIEAVAYQRSLKYWVRARAEQQGTFLPVRDIPRTKKKVIEIRGLQPIAASGRLFLDSRQHKLREQLLDFPDPSVHDDVVDALSMHLKLFQGTLETKHVERQHQQLTDILRRIDGYNLKAEPDRPFDDDEADDDLFTFPEIAIQRPLS